MVKIKQTCRKILDWKTGMRNSSRKMAGKIDVIGKHILDQKIDIENFVSEDPWKK